MPRKLLALLVLGMSVTSPVRAQDPFEDSEPTEAEADASASEGYESEAEETTASEGTAAAPAPEVAEEEAPAAETSASASVSVTGDSAAADALAGSPEDTETGDAEEPEKKKKWEVGLSGYFRAPITMGFSQRPPPDDLTGQPELQISYGPNRVVDSNYFSFAYTRLQEQDWVELFVHAKAKHVQATVGWMGYWFAGAGFRIPDAAWLPGVAYLTLDTDLDIGKLKPNVALSAGAWWPKFGRHEKYDTYTLGQYRQIGEQLKLTVPITEKIKTAIVQGFGTGRDGSFNYGAPPLYQGQVGLNLLHYLHLQFNYGEMFEVGLHNNFQWTRDPNLYKRVTTPGDKSYMVAKEAGLMTVGGEVKANLPRFGSLWVSPSFITIKNGWALGEAGVEVVHSLSPEGLAGNYLGWSGSPAASTGTGTLFNLGFHYQNKLSTIFAREVGGTPEVTFNAFGLLVDAKPEVPAGSPINPITQFKWGADVEYNPWKWMGLMLRWDSVNYDMKSPGYLFSAITSRVSFYTHYLSGERIYLQYSRYRYGDNMTLAGQWPSGVPLVPGSDTIQSGVYAQSKPDMDVVKIQADISF